MYEMEAKKREADFNVEVAKTAIDKVKEVQVQMNDMELTKLLNVNIADQEETIENNGKNRAAQDKLIDELCNSQMKREDVAILSMEDRLEEMVEESVHLTQEYKSTQSLANSGNQNARVNYRSYGGIQTHELSMKSLEAQLRLLKEQEPQPEQEAGVRRAPISIRVKGSAIGEASPSSS